MDTTKESRYVFLKNPGIFKTGKDFDITQYVAEASLVIHLSKFTQVKWQS